ncbi:hypothetical protein ZWY2020_059981 [Hordeum vulgare]|nr:hypothetical protein ZWY2020_059981 [Hordeum vulgare]
MDSSHVTLVTLLLRSEGFEHYRCDRNLSMGMNLGNMAKMLRCAGSNNIITIKADDGSDTVTSIFLRRNFSRLSFYRGYLEEPCLWVETNNTSLSLLSSNAELALGFLLIISLFSWWRNFMQTFIYWNVLKMMYPAPVTSGYH